jgi:hypothetical protein
MKTRIKNIVIAVLLVCISAVGATGKKQLAGPKGGRLLETTEPKAEFFLEKDHTATITVYDVALKPVPVAAQTVTIIAETKEGKAKIEFEKKGEVLVSKNKLPEGDGYNLVVQFRESPNSKPQNFRFKLDTNICGGCKRAEYACDCHE